jgi:hypothetical protein
MQKERARLYLALVLSVGKEHISHIKFKKKTKKKYLKLTLALTLPELLVELKLAKLAPEPLLALLLTSFYN